MGRMIHALFIVPILVIRAPVYAEEPVTIEPEFTQHAASQKVSNTEGQSPLGALYAIPHINQSGFTQPHQEFDALYQAAIPAQNELETLVQSVALSSNGTMISPGVKSKPRSLTKISTELEGDASKLTDIVRASIETDSVADLVTAYEKLTAVAKPVEVINRFKKPQPSGYRDIKVLVELPESGLLAEVQLHLEAISEIKSGPEHKIYQQIQQIERLANSEKRYLTEYEGAKINALRAESKAMYQNAWDSYLNVLSVAV